VSEYTDEALADALRTLALAVRRLEDVDGTIDANEPLRDRIAAEIDVLAGAATRLESVLAEASQELL
jgi:hypothetical protein